MQDLPVTQDMRDLVSDWIKELQDHRRLSAHSCESYMRDLRQFLFFLNTHLGKLIATEDFTNLHIRDVRAFLAARRDTAQNRSLARSLSALRGFDKFLRKRGQPACAALENIQSPKQAHRLPRPVEAETVTQMLHLAITASAQWQGSRDVALITLLYGCGLRITEALSLTADEVRLALERQVLRVRGKGGKLRDVPLLPIIISALTDYKAVCPEALTGDDLFFRGPRGPFSPRQAQYMIAKLRHQLGLPDSVTPHALRHSFASHLLAGGADLRTIQELLGHASLSSTQIYTEIDTTQLRSVYDKSHPRARR